ncbi:MAG TPA: RNA polymerase sigma factor [Acidimicrobiales bacterium]|nr:RNA polymerase sigma factor [Acidimicrobiales bacterium]
MTRPTREDELRFRTAFQTHYDALLAYALRRTTSRDDAEEAVATTFATAWRRIDAMPEEPATIIWLYRVTWRTLANVRRSNARRGRLITRVGALRPTEDASDLGSNLDDVDERLLLALRHLKENEQEVLRLVVWEELSYAEAAEVLECTPNAFAIRLHRARASLREAASRLSDPPSEPELRNG